MVRSSKFGFIAVNLEKEQREIGRLPHLKILTLQSRHRTHGSEPSRATRRHLSVRNMPISPLFAFSHCGSGPFGERGGTAATRPAMHFNASLTNTTRRARSLTKPRNKSLMMEGFYSPHYALLEALTAGRHNLDLSSWLVDTTRPIPANQ